MLYFWSDTHFNHTGIIKYCSRPYASVEEMNKALVDLWNQVVTPKDTIYLLGDFAFSGYKLEAMDSIFDSLNGHKHLIVGNHDEKNPKTLKLPWESISWLKVVKDSGQKIVVCHYPLETWPSAHHGYLHLHGHSHGTLKRKLPHRFDVGVDALGHSGPLSLDFIVKMASEEPYIPQDHHGDL